MLLGFKKYPNFEKKIIFLYRSLSHRGSISDANDADESSDGEDALEAKTPVAQNYRDYVAPVAVMRNKLEQPSPPPISLRISTTNNLTTTSAPLLKVNNPSLASRDSSVLDLAVPFGADPLKKWQDSKHSLLVFGPSNYDKTQGTFERDADTQSVSTVSGSGMDFFRKFVQRKAPKEEPPNPTDQKDCKECEDQFRREVLIDRLVSDALQVKALKKSSSSKGSISTSSQKTSGSSSGEVSSVKLAKVPGGAPESSSHFNDLCDDEGDVDQRHGQVDDLVGDGIITVEEANKAAIALRAALESSCSSGKCVAHRNNNNASVQQETDIRSVRSSICSNSTVSGSGLLFLRNYLKKKSTKPPVVATEGTEDCTTLIEDVNNQQSESTLIGSNHSSSLYHPMVFNTVPIPFPPKDDFYGPAQYIPDELAFYQENIDDVISTRRNSVGSTIADLLNDNFDSEDSELRNLDWNEWEEEEDHKSEMATDIESDDASIVIDVLDMAKPVVPELSSRSRLLSTSSVSTVDAQSSIAGSISTANTEYNFETDSACSNSEMSEPTYEELKNIKIDVRKKKKQLTIPFLDLPSPPGSSGSSCSSGSITPTIEDLSNRSILSTPRQQEEDAYYYEYSALTKESNYFPTKAEFENDEGDDNLDDKFEYYDDEEENQSSRIATEEDGIEKSPPKKRLAEFWERRVSGNFEQSMVPPQSNSTNLPSQCHQKLIGASSAESLSKFKPALPSYYDPDGNKKANEKIQRFLDATRKAADDSGVSVWSSNYEKLKRGELIFDQGDKSMDSS